MVQLRAGKVRLQVSFVIIVVVEDRRGWAVVTFEEVYAHARSAVGVVVLCCCLLKV